jgi:hypothetical protein
VGDRGIRLEQNLPCSGGDALAPPEDALAFTLGQQREHAIFALAVHHAHAADRPLFVAWEVRQLWLRYQRAT